MFHQNESTFVGHFGFCSACNKLSPLVTANSNSSTAQPLTSSKVSRLKASIVLYPWEVRFQIKAGEFPLQRIIYKYCTFHIHSLFIIICQYLSLFVIIHPPPFAMIWIDLGVSFPIKPNSNCQVASICLMRIEAALGQSWWSPGGRFTLKYYLNGWTLDPELCRIWYHFTIHIICLNLSLLDCLINLSICLYKVVHVPSALLTW